MEALQFRDRDPYNKSWCSLRQSLVAHGFSPKAAINIQRALISVAFLTAVVLVTFIIHYNIERHKQPENSGNNSCVSPPTVTQNPFDILKRRRIKRLSSSDPIIVWWTEPLWRYEQPEDKIACPVGNDIEVYCTTSSNRSRNTVDAYLFYGPTANFSDLPLPRLPYTIWGLYTDETPKTVEFVHEKALNLFNFSSTFSRYSDVPIPLTWLQSDLSLIKCLKYFVKTSTKNELLENYAPVVYLQSNCHTPTKRNEYVEELMKYIKVDSYGACLNNAHIRLDLQSDSNEWGDYLCHLNEEEMLRFLANYKFIIAIDTVVCSDYVAEKVWRALRMGVVPIYFGSPTIKQWMPNPKSVVMIEDYPKPELLAAYLNDLNANDTAYEEYLLHKTKQFVSNKRLHAELFFRSYQLDTKASIKLFECHVCRQLHRWNTSDVKIMQKSEYNCTQSASALTRGTTKNNSMIEKAKEVIDDIYEKSLNWPQYYPNRIFGISKPANFTFNFTIATEASDIVPEPEPPKTTPKEDEFYVFIKNIF